MRNDLPTLKGLRAFEEVFRQGSFTAAAKALNVQQPAISYQIKRLEEDLGVALFDKEHGRLVPTRQANDLFETLNRAFDSIRQASNDLRQSAKPPSFTIATYPGIGTYWLSPRLPALSEALGLRTKLTTLKKDTDLWRDDADCWIIFGHGNWPGHDARLLIREEVCPVAAPRVVERIQSSKAKGWSADIPVIELEDPDARWLNWESWFSQTDEQLPPPNQRIVVNDHGLALHMALAGNGIALAWVGVVDELLTGKSLIKLSSKMLASEAGYWLVGASGFFDTRPGQLVLECLENGNPVPRHASSDVV